MGKRRIKGITIEIGGDTAGLQKALSNVNGKIENTQSQLKDVERLLKLDPSNTVLVAQKQELLSNAIAETAQKLEKLESAQEQVNAAMESGKVGQEQYMAFQREIEETKAKLVRYETELESVGTDQERLAENTQRLNKFFDAVGGSVDDYANVLGSRLTTAIKNGTASSDQLRLAIEKIGNAATGGKTDIQRLTEALDTVDDGQAIQNLIQELKRTGEQSEETKTKLEQMTEAVTGGVMVEAADQLQAVSDKITEIGESAADAFTETQDATVKASVYFGETGAAAEETAGVIKDIYMQGVGESMDAVSDAVITVKKNLQDLDQTTLTNLTQQAITLEELYGIDMNETIRGVNALMVNFGMDAQQAMDYIVVGTQNGLDKTNELGDNLAEYSGKFAQAGYSAQDYFQILQNGLEGGAYNLDKVNDAINEVTTRLADGTIEDKIGSFSTKTQELFAEWQVGGATQKEVIDSIVQDIQECENQQGALNLAAIAFGTMAEDGSQKFIKSMTTVGDTYDDVLGAAQGMFDNSTTESQKLEASIRQLQESLLPLGELIVNLANTILPPLVAMIQKVADFFGSLPEPVQNFVVILGGMIAAFTALAPAITAVAVAVALLNAPLLPIIGIIAAVAAAITLIITAFNNWGTITQWFGTLWNTVCTGIQNIWQNVSSVVSSLLNAFVETIKTVWNNIFTAITNAMNNIHTIIISVWNAILSNPIVQIIATTVQNIFTTLSSTLSNIWNNIKSIASNTWELIKNVILGPVLLLIDLVTGDFESLKSDLGNIWSNISNAASNIWSSIKDIISTLTSGIRDTVSQIWNGIKDFTSTIWDAIKNTISDLVSGAKDAAVNGFNALKDGVNNAITELPGIVSGIFEQIKNIISGLIDSAFTWGSDFVNGLKDGIMSGVSAIVDTVQGIGEKIRSYLHFSRPDVGPLRDYETWMPDFMEGMTKGIYAGIPMIEKAVKAAATAMDYSAMKTAPEKGLDYNLLYKAVKNGTQQNDIILVMKDREVGRALREMGVVFG